MISAGRHRWAARWNPVLGGDLHLSIFVADRARMPLKIRRMRRSRSVHRSLRRGDREFLQWWSRTKAFVLEVCNG